MSIVFITHQAHNSRLCKMKTSSEKEFSDIMRKMIDVCVCVIFSLEEFSREGRN